MKSKILKRKLDKSKFWSKAPYHEVQNSQKFRKKS